jgi:hypothetical protein
MFPNSIIQKYIIYSKLFTPVSFFHLFIFYMFIAQFFYPLERRGQRRDRAQCSRERRRIIMRGPQPKLTEVA